MTVIVAEYLGVRTDRDYEILPVITSKQTDGAKPFVPCPFKKSHCDKALRGDKPVCSVRDTNTRELWIVCSHRLCATQPKISELNDYQKSVLVQVAAAVFNPPITQGEILFDREVSIPISSGKSYSADFVMWRTNPETTKSSNPERPILLEMQGGGETTSTGDLTSHITMWEKGQSELTSVVKKTAPLVTNAWRRQQEQFLVKGNVAMQSGGRMVFCVGSMIYDYLIPRLKVSTNFADLKNANWTLALLTFIEDTNPLSVNPDATKSIPLIIDKDRSLYTNYSSFVQAITNQGSSHPTLFNRKYIQLESTFE